MQENWQLVISCFIASLFLLFSKLTYAEGLMNAANLQRQTIESGTKVAPLNPAQALNMHREPQTESSGVNRNSTEVSTSKSSITKGNHISASKIGEKPEENPYALLVKLAFTGKGSNDINSYVDAAAFYCSNAKDNNDQNALFALAWMYANGRGVDKDIGISRLLFKKAADQGHKNAQHWLSKTGTSHTTATLPTCMHPDQPKQSEVKIVSKKIETQPSFYKKGPIYKIVAKHAPRYNIETDLVMAFIAIESGYDPKATSNKNAQGLMQLIPATAARFNVKNPYDPEQNIKGGIAYLQWLLAFFKGDVLLVSAAYNAGENAVERYKGVPPYSETRKYVKKIAALYKKTFHPYQRDLNLNKTTSIITVSRNQ